MLVTEEISHYPQNNQHKVRLKQNESSYALVYIPQNNLFAIVLCCIVGPIPAVVLVAQLVYELLLSVMRCNTAISSLEEVVLFSFALPLPC